MNKKWLLIIVVLLIGLLFLSTNVFSDESPSCESTTEYESNMKYVQNSDCVTTLTIYSGTAFTQNSEDEWVDASDVLSVTKYQDDITFHYDGNRGYFNVTFEAGAIYNGNYYSFSEIKQMKPGLEYEFPSEKHASYHKYAVNISNITTNLNIELIESITLTYKSHYGFTLDELKQNDRWFDIKDTMSLYFNDLFELYDVSLNKTEKRVYIENITDNIVDDVLYLDPSVVISGADVGILDDTSVRWGGSKENENGGAVAEHGIGELGGYRSAVFVKFNNSIYDTPGITITNAVFYGNDQYNQNYASGVWNIYGVEGIDGLNWTEGNGTNTDCTNPQDCGYGIVYNRRPTNTTGVLDTASGLDSTGFKSFNITSFYESEKDQANITVFITGTDVGADKFAQFTMKEHATVNTRPYVEVNYTVTTYPTYSNVRTLPASPRYPDATTLNVDVVGTDPVTQTLFSLVFPNGTSVFSDINGTQSGNTWTSPSHTITSSGVYEWWFNATANGVNDSATSYYINISFGTMTVQATDTASESYPATIDLRTNSSLQFGLSASHTGNSNSTIIFQNFGENITDITGTGLNVTINSASVVVTNGTTVTSMEINISSHNESMANQTVKGYVFWNRTTKDVDGLDTTDGGSIEIDLTIIEQQADPPSVSGLKTSPVAPRYDDNVSLLATATDPNGKGITDALFTLIYPNGTVLFSDLNGTQNGDEFTAPQIETIDRSGIYEWYFNATNVDSFSTNSAYQFINITFGTMSVLSPDSDTDWSAGINAGSFEYFNMTASHTGNSPSTVEFFISSNMTNTSAINTTISITSTEVQNGTSETIEVNVSSKDTVSSGTYTGYVFWNRTYYNESGDAVIDDGSVEIMLSVATYIGDINITVTTFVLEKVATRQYTHVWNLQNDGNYKTGGCVMDFTSSLNPTVSFNQTNFTIQTGGVTSVSMILDDGLSAIDESAVISIECSDISNVTTGIDTDAVTGTLKNVGGSPGGSGGVVTYKIYDKELELLISPEFIRIDAVPVTSKKLWMKNTGIDDLSIYVYTSDSIEPITSFDLDTFVLQPNESREVIVTFSPSNLNYDGLIIVSAEGIGESYATVQIDKVEPPTITGMFIYDKFREPFFIIPRWDIPVPKAIAGLVLSLLALGVFFVKVPPHKRTFEKKLLMFILVMAIFIVTAFLLPTVVVA